MNNYSQQFRDSGVPRSIGGSSMYNEDDDAKQSMLDDDNMFSDYSPNTLGGPSNHDNEAPLLHLQDSVDVDPKAIRNMLADSPNDIGVLPTNQPQARLLKLEDSQPNLFNKFNNSHNNNNNNNNINKQNISNNGANNNMKNNMIINANNGGINVKNNYGYNYNNNNMNNNYNNNNMNDQSHMYNDTVLIKASSNSSNKSGMSSHSPRNGNVPSKFSSNNTNINNNNNNNNNMNNVNNVNNVNNSKHVSFHSQQDSSISNKSYPAPPHNKTKHWRCGICTFAENSMDSPVCQICGALPPKDAESTSSNNNSQHIKGSSSNGSQFYDRNQSISGPSREHLMRYKEKSSVHDLLQKVGIQRPQTPPAQHRSSLHEKHHFWDENQNNTFFAQKAQITQVNSNTVFITDNVPNNNNNPNHQIVKSEEFVEINSLFGPTSYQPQQLPQQAQGMAYQYSNPSQQNARNQQNQQSMQPQSQLTQQLKSPNNGANSHKLGSSLKRQQSIHTRSRSANYQNQVTDLHSFIYPDDEKSSNNNNNNSLNTKSKSKKNSQDASLVSGDNLKNNQKNRPNTKSKTPDLEVPMVSSEDAAMNRVSITNHDLPNSEKQAIHSQLLALETKKDLQIELYSVKMTLQKKVKQHEKKIETLSLQVDAMKKQYELQKAEWKKYAAYDLLELCEQFYSKFFLLKEEESEIERLYINCLEMKMSKLVNAYQKLEKHMTHWDIGDVREYIKSALYTVFRIRISSDVGKKKKENSRLTKEIKKLQSEYAKQKQISGQKEVNHESRKEEIKIFFDHAVIDNYNAWKQNFQVTYRYFLDPSLQKRFNSFLRDERVECGKILKNWVDFIERSLTLGKEVVLSDVYIFAERMVNTFIKMYELNDSGKYTYSEYVARFVYPSILCIPIVDQCVSNVLKSDAGMKELEKFATMAEYSLMCKLLSQKLS